jgi:hypothetical protein
LKPSTETQLFCVECGAPSQGGRYCSRCGAALPAPLVTASSGAISHDGEEQTETLPISDAIPPQPTRRFQRKGPPPMAPTAGPYANQPASPGPPVAEAPAATAGRPRWLPFVLGGVLLVAAVAVVLFSGVFSNGTDWQAKASQALAPVDAQNVKLSAALSALTPSEKPAAALVATQATQAQLAAGGAALGSLDGTKAPVDAARRALAAETSYVNAVKQVFTSPASSQLSALAATAQDRLGVVDPAYQDHLNGYDKLVSWSNARQQTKTTRRGVRAFASEVDSLLQRSAPSKQEISSLLARMEAAANGTGDITLAEATSGLSDVISNRSGLAGAARSLSAPTPQGVKVRSLLATAFDDSLTDDRAIQDCLTQAQDIGLPDLFSSCLQNTGAQSNTASAAKQTFRDAYNRLRAHAGLGAISTDF